MDMRDLIEKGLMTETEDGEPRNVVDALLEIAGALRGVASALRDLGKGDAGDPRGAVEFLASEVRDGFAGLSSAIEKISGAIDDHPGSAK